MHIFDAVTRASLGYPAQSTDRQAFDPPSVLEKEQNSVGTVCTLHVWSVGLSRERHVVAI